MADKINKLSDIMNGAPPIPQNINIRDLVGVELIISDYRDKHTQEMQPFVEIVGENTKTGQPYVASSFSESMITLMQMIPDEGFPFVATVREYGRGHILE